MSIIINLLNKIFASKSSKLHVFIFIPPYARLGFISFYGSVIYQTIDKVKHIGKGSANRTKSNER